MPVRAPIVACILVPAALLGAELEAAPTPQPDEEADQAAQTASDAPKRENELVVVPNPSYNPTFGAMLTVMSLYAYRPEGNTGRPWMVGGAAFAAQNGSWGAVGFQEARPGDGAWRIQAGAGYVDLRYDYYGAGPDSPLADDPVGLRQRVALAGIAVLKRFGTYSYLGPVVNWRSTRTTLDDQGPLGLEMRQDIGGVGVRSIYDSRDEQFSPTRGVNAEARFLGQAANDNTLGAMSLEGVHYERLELSASAYRIMAPGLVLAARAATQWTSDDTPFFDLPFLGRGADLRGYSGQYRDRTLSAVQVEARQELPHRFGVNAFAGIGAVAPSYAEQLSSELHPSLGVGLSYLVAPSNRIKARLDAAWGDLGWTAYIAIGDAF